jgi:protein-tyrosine phosphatase
VQREDFERFSWILAMDSNNLRALHALRPQGFEGHICLYLELVSGTSLREIPDPYYGALAAFERVLDLMEAPGDALITNLVRTVDVPG